MKPISDDDLALAAAFLDGELEPEERTRFELRLADDPGLAEHVERMLVTDEFVRRHAGTTRAAAPRRRLRLVPVLLGTAAAAAALLVLHRLRESQPDDRDALVCLRASHESATEWIQDAPALRGLRPPGLDELRAPSVPPDADPRAFVAAARRIEASTLDAPPRAEVTAGFYSIPLRLFAAGDVLVAAFPERGAAQLLWPVPGGSARLAAGDHVLPSPSFELVDDAAGPRVAYRRGYLVPLGAGRVDVVVGVRASGAEPLDAALLVPADDAREQERRWEAVGFAVQTFTVREP